MTANVGIASAAACFPEQARTLDDLVGQEGAIHSAAAELGVGSVRACTAETGSMLALRAATEAMRKAGVEAAEIDVIVDYSVTPQEYLVPAWSMSNKLQAEIGATKSFTIGFSGGASSNLLVALRFASAHLRTDDSADTALLLAADVAIPGNRILNPEDPTMVLGDGASALVLRRGLDRAVLVGCEIRTDGALHDVCYIPGGAMNHPDRADLYRMKLDTERYRAAPRFNAIQVALAAALDRVGSRREDVATFVYPNISTADRDEFFATFQVDDATRAPAALFAEHGHLMASDLVMNYITALEHGSPNAGDLIALTSHGLGFMAGAALVRC